MTSISLTLAACAPLGRPAEVIAQNSLSEIGCKTSQSAMWSSFHKVIEDAHNYPSPNELRKALKNEGFARGLPGAAFERYIDAFVENYQTTILGIESTRIVPRKTAVLTFANPR